MSVVPPLTPLPLYADQEPCRRVLSAVGIQSSFLLGSGSRGEGRAWAFGQGRAGQPGRALEFQSRGRQQTEKLIQHSCCKFLFRTLFF